MSKFKRIDLRETIRRDTRLLSALQAQVNQDHHAGEGVSDKIPMDRISTNPDNPRQLPITVTDIVDYRDRVRAKVGNSGTDEQFFTAAVDMIASERDVVQSTLEEIILLAKSIGRNGLFNPISVYREQGNSDNQGSRYTILSGERRFLAHTFLSRPTIKAEVREKETDRVESLIGALAENINREDLSTAEEFTAVERLVQLVEARNMAPLDGAGLHHLVAKSPRTCRRYLQLIRGPEEVRKAIREGRLTNFRDAERALHTSLDDVLSGDTPIVMKTDFTVSSEIAEEGSEKKKKSMEPKAGRKRLAVSLGKTSDITSLQLIMRKVLGNDKYTQVARDVNWTDYDSVQQAWTQFFQSIVKS